MANRIDSTNCTHDAALARIAELEKYWEDEKRRYDAADKAFRLVCDERDSLASRLDTEKRAAEAALVAFEQAENERIALLGRLDFVLGTAELACFAGDARSYKSAMETILIRLRPAAVEKRRDLFSELKEGLESIPVEKPLPKCQKCRKPSRALTNGYCDPCIGLIFAPDPE